MHLLASILAVLPLISAFHNPNPPKGVAGHGRICGRRGSAIHVRPFFSQTNRRLASVDACRSHCLKQRQCLSFAVGRGGCMNFKETA
jgi:hypothetical protein